MISPEKNGNERIFDALVVGAGPAGSACAARLAEAGWAVALVDRATPGRERVCGGFLGPEFEGWTRTWGWRAEFDRLAKRPVNEVLVSGEGSRLVRTGLPQSGFAVDRGVFDRWIADLAVARGVRLWTETTVEALGRMHGMKNMAGSDRTAGEKIWTARIYSQDPRSQDGETIRARHWINATGRRSAPAGKTDAFFACKAVYENVRGLSDGVALHFVERGHVGLNPLSDGQATLCLCVDGRYLREARGNFDAMMQRLMSANANLKSALEGARRLSSWKTCQAEPDQHPIFFKDEKFNIGDALSMVNPVIGGGIPIAMQSGVLLADFLIQGKIAARTEAEIAADFERAWRQSFSKKFKFGKWLGSAERSAFASRLVMSALNAAPRLLPRLVRMARPVAAR